MVFEANTCSVKGSHLDLVGQHSALAVRALCDSVPEVKQTRCRPNVGSHRGGNVVSHCLDRILKQRDGHPRRERTPRIPLVQRSSIQELHTNHLAHQLAVPRGTTPYSTEPERHPPKAFFPQFPASLFRAVMAVTLWRVSASTRSATLITRACTEAYRCCAAASSSHPEACGAAAHVL